PVASVRGRGDEWALVDRTGRVLEHVPAAAPDVPAIENTPRVGIPGSHVAPMADGALSVAAEISPARAKQVRIIVVLPDGSLELRVLTGKGPAAVVRLGLPDDLAAKLLATFTVLDRVDLRRLAVIDVRVP